MGRPSKDQRVAVTTPSDIADRKARQLALRLRVGLFPDTLAGVRPSVYPKWVHDRLKAARTIDDPLDRLSALLALADRALPLFMAVDGGGPHSISRDVARIVNRAREAQEGRTA